MPSPRKADGGLQQRRLHLLADAGAFPGGQRRQHTVAAEDAAEVIGEGRPRAVGVVQLGEDAQQPAQGLADGVVAGPLPVRAVLAEGGDGTVDDARVHFAHHVVADAQTVHHPGPEVLDDDIRVPGQPQEDFLALGRLHVQGQALLVAVEGAEARAVVLGLLVPGAERVPLAGGLDLGHLRPQVGQQQRRVGTGDVVGDVEDLDTFECSGHGVATFLAGTI